MEDKPGEKRSGQAGTGGEEPGGEKPRIVISQRLVSINALSSIVTRILNITVLVWMYQYLLARIPDEEFAVYPVVTAIMVFAPLFFAVLTSGISRHVIDAYAKGDLRGVSVIISSILPLLAALSGLFVAVGLAFSFTIEQFLNIPPQMVGETRLMMALLVVGFAVQMMALPFATGYHVKQRFLELNLLMVVRDLLRIAMLLAFLFGIGPGVIWVVVATVVSETLFQVTTIFRSLRMVPELVFRRELVDWPKARELVGFGVWTTLGRLGATMYTNAATLILNLHGSAIDVTSYFIGATFFRQLEGMIGTAVLPLQPALTAMNALNDKARFASAVLRGGRYGLWASMIVATPLIVYAEDFILLYLGPDYAAASMVIVLFMLIPAFNQPTTLLPLAAIAMARVREFFLPAFLFQLLGLGLMLLFAMRLDMGAVGVTLALTLVTVGSQVFYYWWLGLRFIERPFADFLRQVLVPGLAPALAGALAWYGAKLVLPITGWLELFACGALGAVVYVGVLLGFCLDARERQLFRKLLARVGLSPK